MDKSVPEQLKSLSPRLKKLLGAKNWQEKLEILEQEDEVKKKLCTSRQFADFYAEISVESRVVIASLIAIEQAPQIMIINQSCESEARLLPPSKWSNDIKERLQRLIDQLIPVEKFYWEIGGIVGYHKMVLQFLSSGKTQSSSHKEMKVHPPMGIDISQDTEYVQQAKLWGLESLPMIAEIYALGGAADRLRLYDEATGIPLPAARLCFAGRTLLENLVLDLEAREYLYFKLFAKQLFTPIAMMTSPEKENHAHVLAICEEKEWFGRPKEFFRFFCQPLVPTVNSQGRWCTLSPFKLLMKPGGHGVLWKLARDEGIFAWFEGLGRKKALIRQINNPIAGTDYGLLAFSGIGCKEDKIFGFASCERQVKASEGVNVLIERKTDDGSDYVLSNIEYCDFSRYGIVDEPKEEGSPYSKYPSNTNILFADLKAVEQASIKAPMPGLLINLKKTAFLQENGRWKEEEIARLESTMQNIADDFCYRPKEAWSYERAIELPAFVTFNNRRKTISTVKREFSLGSSLLETPEGCFIDQLKNAYELLHEHCKFDLPQVTDAAEFFSKGPPFIFFYHPSLGPLFEVMAQKIRGGRLARSAELQLDLAEIDIESLDLKGSLLIEADAPMGCKDENGILDFKLPGGRCLLHNVSVKNSGVDQQAHQFFWRNEISRKECCRILLHGMAEFEARNVELDGNLFIEVEHGQRVIAFQGKGGVEFRTEQIEKPTWSWAYHRNPNHSIQLVKTNS